MRTFRVSGMSAKCNTGHSSILGSARTIAQMCGGEYPPRTGRRAKPDEVEKATNYRRRNFKVAFGTTVLPKGA